MTISCLRAKNLPAEDYCIRTFGFLVLFRGVCFHHAPRFTILNYGWDLTHPNPVCATFTGWLMLRQPIQGGVPYILTCNR